MKISNLTPKVALVCMLLSIGSINAGGITSAPQRTAAQDKEALIELENTWLKGEHDARVLESILAPDFVHPVVTGDFLTKAQHIYYSSKRLPPANLKQSFEQMNVRLYADVGIVNGIVVTSDQNGQQLDRSIFTDVFAYREGHWQAINAQENSVEQLKPPK
jgi:Domain of unknown function (DUF4440)